MQTLPIERDIVRELKTRFNNNKIKVDDILEWSTSEEAVDKNLREGEIKLTCAGVFLAVKKELDKSLINETK